MLQLLPACHYHSQMPSTDKHNPLENGTSRASPCTPLSSHVEQKSPQTADWWKPQYSKNKTKQKPPTAKVIYAVINIANQIIDERHGITLIYAGKAFAKCYIHSRLP